MAHETGAHSLDGPLNEPLGAAETAVDTAAKASQKTIDTVVDAVSETVRASSEKARQFVDAGHSDLTDALNKTDEVSSTIKKSVTDHPLKAVAIVALVAAVCGFLIAAVARR